ncbi:hypothetical protein BLNAU_11138 [Blattamonas nauphoetae]|uniref:Uncharacterized protein n=1 Tax=Blattamonas nauphoetae TaxID=2049346 RepID=A0ABQ9XNA2_9EUKA|nr:hypothetical protein BLNAU_11138 [Blattamonas nauphoetae]
MFERKSIHSEVFWDKNQPHIRTEPIQFWICAYPFGSASKIGSAPILNPLLDSSLRTLSSSPNFRQESLRLLTILHSLLTSPLPPSPTKQFRRENYGPRLALVEPDPINPSELFDSSLFDEADNEKLARSLVRCKSVCEIVGAEKCILDIPNFIDRTVSALGTSDSLLREAAFSLYQYFDGTSNVIPLLPHLWNRLHSAFRDGHDEEQWALIRISSNCIIDQIDETSLPPFPATEFDWDGLINADVTDLHAFLSSIIFRLLIGPTKTGKAEYI